MPDVSRNAPDSALEWQRLRRLLCPAAVVGALLACSITAGDRLSVEPTPRVRAVIVHDPQATESLKARPGPILTMVESGLKRVTQQTSVTSAWRSLVTTNDVIGIKVYCAPGPDAGTRLPVVASLVETLLAAKIPPSNVIIWDRQKAELRAAGFVELGQRYGVRVEGSVNAGYDEESFYSPDRPLLGQLIWGDVEFGRKGDGVGRRSFVSRLVSREMTKIVIVTPLLNHNTLGVCGHLYSLAFGSVDNTIRFENDLFRLATAVPDIYALPALGDKVVLCVTDALFCQYEGEKSGQLHYTTALNELRFSKDPVALDVLALRDLERQRIASGAPPTRGAWQTNQMELLHNAALLELGVSDSDNIRVERVP